MRGTFVLSFLAFVGSLFLATLALFPEGLAYVVEHRWPLDLPMSVEALTATALFMRDLWGAVVLSASGIVLIAVAGGLDRALKALSLLSLLLTALVWYALWASVRYWDSLARAYE